MNINPDYQWKRARYTYFWFKKKYQQCYVETHGKSKTHWKILLMFIFRNEHGKNMGLTFIHVVKQ